MRNPNGYGSIIDLGKNRRRRYGVRITDTYTSALLSPDGTFKQKYKYIGYYATVKEAKKALADYNNNQTPTNYVDITFAQVWERWCSRNLTEKDTARYRSYLAAFKKCSALHDRRMQDIRLNDLEEVIDLNSGSSKSTLNNIKIVMNFIFTWALQNDVILKNYVDFLTIKEHKTVESHKAFKADEISNMWKHKDLYIPVLIYIYTGCRPIELLDLNKADVHIAEKYFYISKSKTKAGIRIVPIADKIMPFFEYYMSQEGDKLLPFSYNDLRLFYSANIPSHTPHDTRSTCVSLLTSAGVREVIIQKIVGHSGGNVTRDVYTQLELPPLLEAINKI